MTMSCDDTGASGVHRFEVFTGAGKLRHWSREVKASIITESYFGLETVCALTRQHGQSPSQLFTRHRELRKQLTAAQLGAPLDSLDWRRVHGGRRPIAPQIAG